MAGFQDIIGQEQMKEHMQRAIASGNISHAYIIAGEKACGKRTIAGIFAQTLQCEAGGTEPCMKCRSCKQTLSGNQPDIIYLPAPQPKGKAGKEGEKKSTSIGVDEIRSRLNNDIVIKPYSSPRKIYILQNAEQMTVQAQNALLKTLEEPPSYGVILLLTTNVNGLLPTILSRCVVLNMKPVPDETVERYLMEQCKLPDYQAQVCAAFARGNIGRAKELAGSSDFERMKSDVLSILKYVREMSLSQIMEAVKKAGDYKQQINDYLDICVIWYRDVLFYKATAEPNRLVFREEISAIRNIARDVSYEGIEDVIQALDKAKRRIEANVNFDLAMELLFLEIKEKG